MLKDIENLFGLIDEVLFYEAQTLGIGYRKLRASPIPIIGTCTTQPACRHCRWENTRRVNPDFNRKRTHSDILQRIEVLIKAGIDWAFMPSGWMGYEVPEYFCEYVTAVKKNSKMEVYGLFGAVNKKSLIDLRNAGMDGILCGIESPNEEVYRIFRPGGDSLADRKETLYAAREIGLKLWSGFILGVGETQEDVIHGLEYFAEIGVDSISILPFVPTPYSDMWGEDPVNPLHWARTVAVSRLYLKTANIFVTMDGGYVDYGRITGANGNYIQLPDKL